MSDCSCIYVDYEDSPRLYKANERTARKSHQCTECGREIEPGERYECAVGDWGDGLSVYKTCADCLSVRNEFFCESWIFTEVWERVGEHISDLSGNISERCIASLTPRARDHICDMIEEYWDEL